MKAVFIRKQSLLRAFFIRLAIFTPGAFLLSGGAHGLNTTQVSQYDVSWVFSNSYQVGRFANGDWWVVGPIVLQDISVVPELGFPTTPAEGRNGFMINLHAGPGAEHAFDSRAPYYNADLQPDLPTLVEPDSSIVATISSNVGTLKTAAVLTVLASPPPEGSFRPPYAGNDKPLYSTQNLQRHVLKTLPYIDGVPDFPIIARNVERAWLDPIFDWVGIYLHPSDNMIAYGAGMARDIGTATLRLMLDDPPEMKEKLLISTVQVGIDMYGLLLNGQYWPANGGHMSGRKWPILFAGIMLDDPGMKGIGGFEVDGLSWEGNQYSEAFQEDCQTFYLTEETRNEYPEFYQNPDWYDPPARAGDAVFGMRACMKDYGQTDYRACCNSQSWVGQVLCARLLNAKNLWNHDALFDYVDWWMEVWVPGDPSRHGYWDSGFQERMWNAYRWYANEAAGVSNWDLMDPAAKPPDGK